MSSYCIISGCKTDKKKGTSKKSIFRFPLKDEKLLKVWLSNIPMDFSNYVFSNNSSRICEDHFEDKFKFKSLSGKYVRLQPQAYPTIFEGIQDEGTSITPRILKKKPRKIRRRDKKEELKKLPITDLYDTCRFCLLTIGEGKIELDDELKEQFEVLTQMELKQSKVYPSNICISCNRNMEFCTKFKSRLIHQQKRLYYSFEEFEEKPKQTIQKFEEVDVKDEDTNDSSNNSSHDDLPDLESYLDVEIKREETESPENSHFVECSAEDVVEKKSRRKKVKKESPLQDDWNFDEFFETKEKVKKTPKPRSSGSQKQTICPECGITIYKTSLDRHIKRKHLRDKSHLLMTCDFCGFTTLFKDIIRKHMLYHANKREYKCDQCLKEFTTITSLKTHIYSVHKKDCWPEHFCEYCAKKFKLKHSLKIHVQQFHLNRPKYVCNQKDCLESFTYKTAFRIHKEKHLNIRHDCPDCNREFYSELEYKQHRKIHDKPYKCNICPDKSFPSSSRLSQHHKFQHQNIRNHSCNFCEKTFFTNQYLTRHIREFHLNIKIHCEILGCKSLFARKETYRNHVLSHHKDLGEARVEDLLMRIRNMKLEIDESMKVVK